MAAFPVTSPCLLIRKVKISPQHYAMKGLFQSPHCSCSTQIVEVVQNCKMKSQLEVSFHS